MSSTPLICSSRGIATVLAIVCGSAPGYDARTNTLGGDNRLCSADYPYYLRERINEKKPVNVLFAIGAIGMLLACKLQAETHPVKQH